MHISISGKVTCGSSGGKSRPNTRRFLEPKLRRKYSDPNDISCPKRYLMSLSATCSYVQSSKDVVTFAY